MKKKSVKETKKFISAYKNLNPVATEVNFGTEKEPLIVKFDFTLTPEKLISYQKIIESGAFDTDEIGNEYYMACYEDIYHYFAILYCFSDLPVDMMSAEDLIMFVELGKGRIDDAIYGVFGYDPTINICGRAIVENKKKECLLNKFMIGINGLVDASAQAKTAEDVVDKLNVLVTALGDSKYSTDEALDIANNVVKKANNMELVKAIIDAQKIKNKEESKSSQKGEVVEFPNND